MQQLKNNQTVVSLPNVLYFFTTIQTLHQFCSLFLSSTKILFTTRRKNKSQIRAPSQIKYSVFTFYIYRHENKIVFKTGIFHIGNKHLCNTRIYNLSSGPHVIHFSAAVATKRKNSEQMLILKRLNIACRQQMTTVNFLFLYKQPGRYSSRAQFR